MSGFQRSKSIGPSGRRKENGRSVIALKTLFQVMPNLCWGTAARETVEEFGWGLQLGRWTSMPRLAHCSASWEITLSGISSDRSHFIGPLRPCRRAFGVEQPYVRSELWLFPWVMADMQGLCCQDGGFISYTLSIWIRWLLCFFLQLYLSLVCTSSNKSPDCLFAERVTRWDGKASGRQSTGEDVLLYITKSSGPQSRPA